ncbi:MAG: hypothetical protein E4H01_11915 [Lysobacterales bacterium]|nr:MAG: hypothetical protein E4H01_11915 [Xanthomonadales bacterium]
MSHITHPTQHLFAGCQYTAHDRTDIRATMYRYRLANKPTLREPIRLTMSERDLLKVKMLRSSGKLGPRLTKTELDECIAYKHPPKLPQKLRAWWRRNIIDWEWA